MTQLTPQPQSGRREREAARRRADVLAVASEIFAEKGYEGAQISAIARVAEVSLATVYAMFKSKEELYQAVFGRGGVAGAGFFHGSRICSGRLQTLLR